MRINNTFNDSVVVPFKDVQPIKREHWVIIDDTEQFIAKCSVCGRTEDSRCIDDMPYCPNCGADMRGDTDD